MHLQEFKMWTFINNCITKNETSILFDKNNKILYIELFKIVKKAGDILKKLLPPKSKCAILCDKGLNTAIAILSCWYIDLVPIPMSKNYGENHCENIINLTNPSFAVSKKDSEKSMVKWEKSGASSVLPN